MRRFCVIGKRASASAEFLLDDLPSTSGRLDVLVRCLRAALLVSHGVRRDVVVYLVLLGGPHAPRTVRVDGATAKFLRPDERSLAVLVKKSLALAPERAPAGTGTDATTFVSVKNGVAVANAGIEAVLADIGEAACFVLDETAEDIRDVRAVHAHETCFFLGDHHGFDDATSATFAASGMTRIGIGPVSVHAEDALAVLSNELDRGPDTP